MQRYSLILVIGLLLFSSCKKTSPEDALLDYLDAQYISLNQEKVNELRAPCYKDHEALDEFFDYRQLPALSDIAEIYDFKIISTSYKGDTAFISVNQVEPSVDEIMYSTIEFSEILSIVSFNDTERKQFINKRIEDAIREEPDIPSVSRIVEYCLILHKGRYKILNAK